MRTTLDRHNHSSLLIVAALLLSTTFGAAQMAADRQDFYLRSVRPAEERLWLTSNAATTGAPLSPDDYAVDLRPGDLVSLRRSFTRTVVDRANSPLSVAYQERVATEAAFGLGTHTSLTFSQTAIGLTDVRGLALDRQNIEVMGLKQTFGAGEGASALSLTRTVTHDMPFLGMASTSTVEALNFHSGLGKTSDLLLQGTRTSSDRPEGVQALNLQGTLKLTTSGGEAPFSMVRDERTQPGLDLLTEKMDFVLPLAMGSGKALAEHHSTFTRNNGVHTKLRTSHLAIPLRLTGQVGAFDHMIVGQDLGTGMTETTTTRLTTPFKIGDRQFTAEECLIKLSAGTVNTETRLAKLLAPLAGGQASIQHQTTTTDAAGVVTQQEQLALLLPVIKVCDQVSVTGQRVSTETLGVTSQDLTDVSVTATPLKPLQVDAKYQLNDQGEAGTAQTHQVRTRLALSSRMALEGRLHHAEAIGVPAANELRLVEFVHDPASGFGLRAGLASYSDPYTDLEDARRMEISAGKTGKLTLNATYSEYDPNTFVRYPSDANIAVNLQQGDPAKFAVRVRYEDQPTRVEPLEAIDVALKALGGTLQVGYQANPMAPNGATVRQADQYEATLGRKLFGTVNMELGYRYLSYNDATDATDQHIRIKLDGGEEARGGKVALAFFTGDFCPPSTTPGVLTPGSMLDLTYSRTWGTEGRLSLTLKHRAPTSASLGEQSTEGRLEFSKVF